MHFFRDYAIRLRTWCIIFASSNIWKLIICCLPFVFEIDKKEKKHSS